MCPSRFSAALLAVSFLIPATALSMPLLRCQVAYAGITYDITAAPSRDPYSAPATDIGGRFRFKPVVIGDATRIDYIKLYAYYQGARQPVMLHAAKYLPPWPANGAPHSLTGLNSLYSPDFERELQFGCALEGMAS